LQAAAVKTLDAKLFDRDWLTYMVTRKRCSPFGVFFLFMDWAGMLMS
jgi:hypothetical protein